MKYRTRETVDAVQFTGHNSEFLRSWSSGRIAETADATTMQVMQEEASTLRAGNWAVRAESGVISTLTDAEFRSKFEPVS